MDLPLVLAGPILRRVDPSLVAVWMAFSAPVEVELRVWEGRVAFDTENPVFVSSSAPKPPAPQPDPPPRPGANAIRIGERLYIAMVTASIPPASGKSFLPDRLYSYDVTITRTDEETGLPIDPGLRQGLGELGMLQTHIVSGVVVPPLGYADRMLPSFALPPSELKDLRIAYGSCRRPLYDDGDALAWMDEALEFGQLLEPDGPPDSAEPPDPGEPHPPDETKASSIGDPRGRIHQLFLGGDQIYADDVARIMMPHVIELGIQLIGRDGDPQKGTPIERVKVDKIQKLRVPNTPPDPADRAGSYRDELEAETVEAGGDLPAGQDHFPPGNRLSLTQRSAQFTSEDGDNHLISFGEFAALYLLVWSPACWGEFVTDVSVQTLAADGSKRALRWLEELDQDDRIIYDTPKFPEPGFADYRVEDPAQREPEIEGPALDQPSYPERIPQHLFAPAPAKDEKPPEILTPKEQEEKAQKEAKKEEERKEAATKKRKNEIRGRLKKHRVHREFLLGLGRVQRLLANVPTYMILDDHDLTDDLFLSPMWRRRVLGSALGQTILTNGMLAYALFQDWGNDPRRYDQVTESSATADSGIGGDLPGDLLANAPIYFPKGFKKGPDPDTFTKFSKMFGHQMDNEPTADGRFRAVRPPLTWHFSVDGPKHQVVALDNRTRRSYSSEMGPPGNVSPEALVDQLPQLPLEGGREVLIVIAPLQVIGPSVLDDLVSPAIYRIKDLAKRNEIASDRDSGLRRMPGTDPDALETWAIEPIAFEHLLKRLSEFPRVVLLSGDVHNSSGNLMSYWRGGAVRPVRFAQFTSSGFKNVMPVYLQASDQSAMLLQQLLRAKLGVVRLGWDRPDEDLVLLPEGRSEDDLVAATRSKLLRSPVLLTDHGWIDDNQANENRPELKSRINPAHPPDWRWKVRPLIDIRSDAERPVPIRVAPINDAEVEAQLADPTQMIDALQTVAARHQAALNRMRNARQMLFRSNFGICRFEPVPNSEAINAIHEVWTQAVDPDDADNPLPVLGPYLLQVAPLGPEDEAPPEELRGPAIVARPVPPRPDE